jgi:hypothetical protein
MTEQPTTHDIFDDILVALNELAAQAQAEDERLEWNDSRKQIAFGVTRGIDKALIAVLEIAFSARSGELAAIRAEQGKEA